jgi:cellulose synthase/poly-beta-1,6-N-acetylglucosamine synthase-like glycosyltransferase
MSIALTILLLGLLGLVLLPVSVLLVQVVCGILPNSRAVLTRIERPSLAVLVPAHNEAAGINATLRNVKDQLGDGDRLVVVADNCSDDTANLAAAAGAEVLKRHDLMRCGKGYALDFGVRHLEQCPPQLVVIVDADCELAAGAIDRIAYASMANGRPVQALYLMKWPDSERSTASIAEFAWIVRNLVRPLGFLRLGLPCQLMGTGMAFPWTLLSSLRLASGNIVEDMKMGLDCARAGFPPLFCPEAMVVSHFPASEAGVRTQRARWEHGHLAMIISELPRLLVDCFRGKGSGVLALALDLCVPPLALLTLLVLVLAGLSAAHALVFGSIAPLSMACVVLLILSAAIGLSWLRFGREVLPFRRLLLAPVYALRKFPLYLKFLIRRQVEWVRSKRDEP